MEKEAQEELQIRQYFLGQLAETEQTRVEERMMADDEYFEWLLVIEDELIDESTSGALSAEDQEGFDRHFLSTSERRERVQFAKTLKAHVNQQAKAHVNQQAEAPIPVKNADSKPVPLIRPARWKPLLAYAGVAAAAMILLAVGLYLWPTPSHPPAGSKESEGMAALRAAYPLQRPTEARIAGLDYAQAPPVTRGSEPEPFNYAARDQAEFLIRDAASKHPDAQSYHDLGRLYLVKHEYDKAIDQFEKALKLDDKNAQLESDYGAALLEMGKKENTGKRLEILARALEHLGRAIELNDSLLEALFNRALCRQEMKLDQQAAEAWRAYLEKDSTSKWADEARQKLQELETQQRKISQSKEQLLQDFINAYDSKDEVRVWNIVRQSREALSGKTLSEQILDKYLEASSNEQSLETKDWLRALSYIGEMEARRAGDLYTSRLTGFCKTLSSGQAKQLAQARSLIKSGHETYSRGKPLEAINFYSAAKRQFNDLQDKCESLFAEYWIGFCYREAGKTEQSLAVAESLAQVCEQENYKWLFMRTLLLLSSAQYNLNEYSKAIGYAHHSLNLAEQIGDAIGTFNALSILIEEYRYINNSRQSLHCVQQSLAVIDSCPLNPIQLGRHYGIVASSFNTFGFYAAAIDYQKEMVRQASSINHAQLTTIAYANLGLIYAKMGNLNEALANVQTACEIAKSNTDENIRKLMMANSSLQKATIYRAAGDWDNAIASYNECLGIYDDLNFRYYTYQALKGRLYCYIAQGEDALAKDELQKTLELTEKYRAKILEGDNRNNFFEDQQSVYDLAIDFEYSRMNDPRKAFEYSEASRARSLLDLLNASGQVRVQNGVPEIDFAVPFQSLSLEAIQQRMPDQAQIIQYAVLDHKLFIWLLSKDKNQDRSFEQPVTQKQLAEKVLHYVDLISRPSAGSGEDERNIAKELFDLLIKPVEAFLDSRKQLCIVADKVLNYLPFGALVSPADKYLVEEHSLLSSPSSSVFIACSEAASRKGKRKPERLLSVGNPSFDQAAFPRLADLNSAAKEAELITAYYPSKCPLIGNAARKARVTDEMTRSDVIHLALHSVADQRSPMHSKLVLAKEPAKGTAADASEAVLEAYEIYRLNLMRARLVVLSACETGTDRYYLGEGMLNLARPFLVAGVPLTVASLWPVNSDLTVELMVQFHRHRTEDKRSTADALRQAQLDMLGSGQAQLQRPYVWASFVAIGGYAAF